MTTIKGIIRAVREASKTLRFLELDDGKGPYKHQIVCDKQTKYIYKDEPSVYDKSKFGEWCMLIVKIRTIQTRIPSKVGKWQHTDEIVADEIKSYGIIDHSEFPIPTYVYGTKSISMKKLLEYPQLRMRHPVVLSIFRIRDLTDQAIRSFMSMKSIKLAQTPILTGADCEGAGETFTITNSDKFFERDELVSLTVSGQLDGEVAALGMSSIYTFGPTFRAEHSLTRRHLAEFWMVEPELCYITYEELQEFIIDFLHYCIKFVLEHGKYDLEYLVGSGYVHSDTIEKLQKCTKDIVRINYSDALIKLRELGYTKEETQFGIDLCSEMETALTRHYDSLVMVLRYPKSLKSFYMLPDKNESDVVECMDILAPNIGEIIGGSMREHDYDKLKQRMLDLHINIPWYLDLRKYSTIPHGGFGLGFDRFVQFLTGAKRIQHVIQAPRYYKKLM